MQLALRLALAAIGILLVAALWVGGARLAGTPVAGGGVPKPDGRGAASGAAKETGIQKERTGHVALRRIDPQNPGALAAGEALERVAPRPPLDSPPTDRRKLPAKTVKAVAKPAPAAPAGPAAERKSRLLYRPVAEAAGVITAGGYRISLAGIEPVEPDTTCPKADGGTWPCGAAARTAFRAWLHGRAMTCNVPDEAAAVTADCTVGGDDAASWLVANGWAKSRDPRFADMAQAAEDGKRGIFGDAPAAFQAAPALPEPPEPPLAADRSSAIPDGPAHMPGQAGGAGPADGPFPPPPGSGGQGQGE